MTRFRMTNCNAYATVDDDLAYLSLYRWYRNNGYAARMGPTYLGKRRIIYLHRVVAGVQSALSGVKLKNKRVRILGHNRLDNRRKNLR